MLFLSVYLYIKKIHDLRVIPLSFIILAFLSVSGPWNMFRICKHQQLKRWEYLLVKNDLLNQGKIDAHHKDIDAKTQTELSSIALYLAETHGGKTLAPYFKLNIDSLFNTNDTVNNYTYNKISTLFSSAGLTFNPYYYDVADDSNYQFYSSDVRTSIMVDSSLFVCFLNAYSNNENVQYKQNYQLNDSLILELSMPINTNSLSIKLNNKQDAIFNLQDYFNEINAYTPSEKYINSVKLKPEQLKKSIIGSTYRYDFILDRIEYNVKNKVKTPISISGYLIIKVKP